MTKKLKFKTPILILSIISLIYMMISLFGNYIYNYYFYNYYFYKLFFSITIDFSMTFYDVITLLLTGIGPILLIIYSLLLFCKGKCKAIVPIILIITFFSVLMIGEIQDFILRLSVLIIFLLTFFAIVGWKVKNKPLIVNLILGIVIEVIIFLLPRGFLTGRNLFTFDFTLGLVFKISKIIAYISMEIALFLLFLNDDVCMKNKKAVVYNAKKQLALLQTRFEMHSITEEEYKSQRAEIIKNI